MGSITHVTAREEVLNRYEYDAWGNALTCEEQVENRFRFAGEQYDSVSQQYYLRARFYNPVIGRFTQEDGYRYWKKQRNYHNSLSNNKEIKSMSDKAKEIMYKMMENKIDDFMAMHNFYRRGRSLNYLKKIDKTKQVVEMIFFSNPSYQPGAIMHVYPWTSICFVEVNEIANRMINDINLVAGLEKSTIRQPIQIFTDSDRWMLFDEKEYSGLAEQICVFLEKNTIPLLKNLERISDFIKIYESKDKRVMMGDAQYIFIISAYILQGNYEKAKAVLEARFGKAALRRRYASIFSYIENEMKNKS